MELHYVKLFFTFRLRSGVADPYALFGLRADFDQAFRRVVSCRRLDCDGCLSSRNCPYPANFGQMIAKDPEAVRRHQKPPLPFVFQFPLLPSAPNSGAAFDCALTLFGSAVQEAGRYRQAVEWVLSGVGASILRVEAQCPGGGRAEVAAGATPPLPLLGAHDPAVSGPLAPDAVVLSLLTPLKLMHNGRLMKEFTFAHFARALMRRVSALAYYYEGAELDLDYRWLSQSSEAVGTAGSDCHFVSWGGRPAGIVGRVCFRGNLEPFHLLLKVGEETHLGKNASFGYGRYRLEPGEEAR